MKTVGFIGAYDKTDLIIYIAKLLTLMDKKVLIIDASTLQKAKYVVPTILPSTSYVTNFENIDIAVGLYSFNAIKEYLGMPLHATFQYDYVFIDSDSPESFENFDLKTADKNFFVTGFDAYSLKRGLEILSGSKEPIPLTKVFFSKNVSIEEEEYFDFLTIGQKVAWNKDVIYFPFEKGDQTTIIENQIASKIRIKKLTQLYKENLYYISVQIIDNRKEEADLRKAFKLLEKGV